MEDAIVENKQAIEMANVYSSILDVTMEAYSSVISNNLNSVMKVLTSITIIMTIPYYDIQFLRYECAIAVAKQRHRFSSDLYRIVNSGRYSSYCDALEEIILA